MDVAYERTIVCTASFLIKFIRSGLVIPSFEFLLVGDLYPFQNLIENRNFDLLSKQWPNIRRLIYTDGTKGKWFEAFGKDLESLYVLGSWARSPPKTKIANFCTKLRHLDIEGGFWRGIDPSMFWRTVGTHLETVCACFDEDSETHTHYWDHQDKITPFDFSLPHPRSRKTTKQFGSETSQNSTPCSKGLHEK